MKIFFDSSAFAKRYLEESGSQVVDNICGQATELALAVICVPEIISALNRQVRERKLPRRDYRKVKQYLADDVRDAMIINLTPAVVLKAIALLEHQPLRAMDALHVACASEWKAELFVSADKRQASAANKIGLKTNLV